MRTFLTLSSSLGLLLALAGLAAAQDDAKAVLDKAIKAHGGEDKLAKTNATRASARGTINVQGQNLAFTTESAVQWPNQFRQEIRLDVGGMKVTIINVLNGDKGWLSAMGQTQDLMGPQLDEIKNELYATWLESLLPLVKEKGFTLSALPETKIKDKPAAGIKVESKDHPEVRLYFDKTSGLLVKSERKASDETGKPVNMEAYYSDFKTIDGIAQPMKVVVDRDGRRFMDAEVTEVKFLDKLDANVFAKP